MYEYYYFLCPIYLSWFSSNGMTRTSLLLLMAIGAMGVGIFTKNFTLAHGTVSSAAFFFAGLSAIT